AFRPSALAGLAVEILDELGGGRAAFLGFSWGATGGCWFAALNPGRTGALVLVGGGPLAFARLPRFPAPCALCGLRSGAASAGAGFGSYTPAVAGAMVYGLCAEPATATYSRLAAAGTPILFLGAEADERSASLERLARLVPQTEIVQAPTSSHELLRDAPEEIPRAVGDRLAEVPSFSPR